MKLGLQPLDIEANHQVDNSDELLAGPVDGEVGRAGFLAEHVDAAVGKRQHIGDLRVPHQEIGEGLIKTQDLRLVQRHMKLARVTEFLDRYLRRRLRLSVRLRRTDDGGCGKGESKDGVSYCAKH